MKTTKAVLVAAMAGALISLPVQAEEHQSRADRVEAFKENLDLNPEQTEKVRSILQHQRQQVETLRENADLSREQKLEKGREMVKTTIDEIRPVLTPEQREKLGQVGERFREAVQSRISERQGGAEGAVRTEDQR